MKIEIHLNDGGVATAEIEIEGHEDQEKVLVSVSEKVLCQIEETGFACIPEDGGYHMIRVDNIKSIKVLPSEEENKATEEYGNDEGRA